jgi:IBR (half RING finger) domain-containing protein
VALFSHILFGAEIAAHEELVAHGRTFCSQTYCHKHISPFDVCEARAECSECGELTCTKCKKTYHEDEECPPDDEENHPDDHAVLDLAQNKGWRRCPGCHAVVEKVEGCSEIE